MDFHAHAPRWAVGYQCRICDSEIGEQQRVMADVDYDSVTGALVVVECVGCHRAVWTAKAESFIEAAKLALHNGASADVVNDLEHRARLIEQRLARLPQEHDVPLSAAMAVRRLTLAYSR